ncbi:class II aldolase/adducin head domain-containing protein [Sutcliffiella rhizosphaerae]|uniref:L-ribulose-5-phosphate 4-epimerase UlaF n=1 Tax=Sutcliffiella rhizosphaerae TaxID=2880967 RepID=A0ABN8A5Q7_9BACI|nr:hypothetical protein [Sutcliffiella rhizosphaerae]CAG9620435.1 L-ribulose-5-phosphate 4-epimerase UlaF [Sutcliffiella rhizosphaerae]
MDNNYIPGVIVNSHGPFNRGKDPLKTVENAVIMEEITKLAYFSIALSPDIKQIDHILLDKHFLRKAVFANFVAFTNFIRYSYNRYCRALFLHLGQVFNEHARKKSRIRLFTGY